MAKVGRVEWARTLLLVGALATAACATETPRESPAGQSQQAITSVVGNVYTATFPLPVTLSAREVLLAADGVLDLRDRSRVALAPGGVPVVNMGTSSTSFTAVGVEAKSSAILSRPRVTLNDRATVFGNVTTSAKLTRGNQTTVTGTVAEDAKLPTSDLTWRVTFPATSRGVVALEPNQTQPLDPGRNSAVSLKTGATLRLKTGVYFFDSLLLEPSSSLLLDEAAGPVELYIKDGLTFRGSVATVTQAHPELLIVDFGTSTLNVEAPFKGNIVAPSAKLVLGTTSVGHSGAFFAQSLELQPDTPVFHHPSVALAPLHPLPPCVRAFGGGKLEAVFGYENVSKTRSDIRVGPDNRFTVAPEGRGQPEIFQPRRVDAAFAVVFASGSVSWSLAGRTVTASASSPACPAESCSQCGQGRTCVGTSCIGVCGDGQCALTETCKTCAADCGCQAGDVCLDSGACAQPIRCGKDWECGAGSVNGMSVDCGACPQGKTCVLHGCR